MVNLAADDSLRLLSDVSKALSSSLELSATLPQVAQLIVARLSDCCIIEIGEEEERRVMALAHRDHAVAQQLSTQIPALATHPGWREGLDIGVPTEIPLHVRGQQVGKIVLINKAQLLQPIEGDLIGELAVRVAFAVDNARLYQRERRLAQTLQTALLPTVFPQTPGHVYHAAYTPAIDEAEVGGDWYDVFPLADGSIALSIGDVAGRGLDAAVIMGEVRQTFRVAAMHIRDPAAVLDLANHLLLLRHEPIMVTAIFGIYDGETFIYGSAGHPPPVLATENGSVDQLPAEGLPLGIEPNYKRTTWTIAVPPGSLLVLYTDGLIEFTRNVQQGEALLAQAVRDEFQERSDNPALSIRKRVLNGHQTADDVAILTLSVGDRKVEELDLRYSAVPVAATLVRQALRKLARDLGLSADQTFSLQVSVGEAVNNVIEHAYLGSPGSFIVCARRERDGIAVRIEDKGRWRPVRKEGRGHGLSIIRTFMKNVEVNLSSEGTTLKFTHDLRDVHKRQSRSARR